MFILAVVVLKLFQVLTFVMHSFKRSSSPSNAAFNTTASASNFTRFFVLSFVTTTSGPRGAVATSDPFGVSSSSSYHFVSGGGTVSKVGSFSFPSGTRCCFKTRPSSSSNWRCLASNLLARRFLADGVVRLEWDVQEFVHQKNGSEA